MSLLACFTTNTSFLNATWNEDSSVTPVMCANVQVSALYTEAGGHQWGVRVAFDAELDLTEELPELVLVALKFAGIEQTQLSIQGGIRVLQHYDESIVLAIEGSNEAILTQFSFDCFTHDHCPEGFFCDAYTAITDPIGFLKCKLKGESGDTCYSDDMCDTHCTGHTHPRLTITDGEFVEGTCDSGTITQETGVFTFPGQIKV